MRRTHLPGPAPVRRTNLTQLILDQLRDYVLSHGLLEEDRLPPERELAAQLDVSRPSLRNALDWLAQRGALRRVQGGGTFLQSTFLTVLAEAHVAHAAAPSNSSELAEARGYLEPLLVQLAAERASSEELAALAADAARAGQRLEDVEFWRLHDLAFHARLAKLSGNSILAEALGAALHQTARSDQSAPLDTRKCHEQHSEILEALTRRDAEAAAQLMREHLQGCHAVDDAAGLRVSA
ncbi:MAG: FadR family transcriptional regulator [Planctomycetaceae bacterium]|nr:FadR family transcriptional regulator [Planctomycetaceae bacterium]